MQCRRESNTGHMQTYMEQIEINHSLEDQSVIVWGTAGRKRSSTSAESSLPPHQGKRPLLHPAEFSILSAVIFLLFFLSVLLIFFIYLFTNGWKMFFPSEFL